MIGLPVLDHGSELLDAAFNRFCGALNFRGAHVFGHGIIIDSDVAGRHNSEEKLAIGRSCDELVREPKSGARTHTIPCHSFATGHIGCSYFCLWSFKRCFWTWRSSIGVDTKIEEVV